MKPEYESYNEASNDIKKVQSGTLNLILVRHGITKLNNLQAFQPWTPVGDVLAEEGKEAARQLGEKLSRIPIHKIYCSDWHRALHTAQIINEQLEPPLSEVIACRGLRDFNFGKLCNIPRSRLKVIIPEFDDIWTQNRHLFEAPEGDNFRDFLKAKKDELMRIIQNNESGNILIVSHSYSIICLLIAALNLWPEDAASSDIRNTSVTIVKMTKKHIPGKLLLYDDK